MNLPPDFSRIAGLLSKAIPLLALLGAVNLCGCAGPGGGSPTGHLNSTEKMMWSTYPLATQKGLATGFVVARRPANGHAKAAPVMVTSYHVLATMGRGPLYVAVRIPAAAGIPQVAVLKLLPRRGSVPFYVRHPLHDVAAFELELPPELVEALGQMSFVEEKALVGDEAAVRAGVDVSFLGFPDVMPGTVGAFPVLRSGKVASHAANAGAGPREFIIDADVYPGDSGAPVFTASRGGRPQVVGMVIQRIGRVPRAFSHLAIAVEAGAIRETLQLLAAREKSPLTYSASR